MSQDVDQLLATLREALRPAKPTGTTEWDVLDTEAHAALDAIASELRQRRSMENGYKIRAHAAEAELERVRAERDEARAEFDVDTVTLERTQARLDRAVEALRVAQSLQPERMKWLREQGVVFDKAPGRVADVTPEHPDYWQHVAFAIYTDLCEVETVARAALTEIEESP